MPRTLLLVGTRKGLFVLESDEERRDWKRSRPVLRGLADLRRRPRPRERDDLRRRGERVARRGRLAHADLGETWEHSSEGLAFDGDGAQALEALRPDRGARPPARGRRGGRHLREPRRRRDLVAPLDARWAAGPRGLERPVEAAARPPRPAGDPPAPRRGEALLGDRPGLRHLRDDRRRRLLGDAQQGPPRRLAAREPGDRLLRPQAGHVPDGHGPPVPAEPLRDAPKRRRRALVDGDHGGAPDRLRLRRGRPPARPRHLLRHPARPRARALHARRATPRSGERGTRARPGSGSTTGFPTRTPTSGVLREGMAIDSHDQPGLYFGTSTGQLFASADEGDTWTEIASYLPGIRSVEVALVA